MSDKRTLTVSNEIFDRFNGLKLRIALTRSNRVPPVNNIIRALMVIGERHYDELLKEIDARPKPNRPEPLQNGNESE